MKYGWDSALARSDFSSEEKVNMACELLRNLQPEDLHAWLISTRHSDFHFNRLLERELTLPEIPSKDPMTQALYRS